MRIYLQTPVSADRPPRYYHLFLQEDLLGGWSLVKQWGFQGASGTMQREYYPTRDEAVEAMIRTRDAQLKRGYRVMFFQERVRLNEVGHQPQQGSQGLRTLPVSSQTVPPPFSDHHGEDFFYADPEREQYLDMLQHLAQYSDELLLVSGEAGSGKSSLLERFLERAEEHWLTCRLEGGERLEADRLFSRIAECFRLDLVGSGNLLQGLQTQLGALQEQQLPVLLIDDAQALSDDALEMVMHLATLEGEHGKLIRVLLFAEARLEQRLAGARFAAMPRPHRLELNGLDESHIAAYLHHRLKAAGYQGAALFSPRELKQLRRESAGLPGPLNQAAHEMLLGRLSQQQSGSGSRRYVQMGVAASALIGTVLGLHDRINALIGGQPQAMTVSAPERPVVRLAEAGNPWAVVIRDGESIQINCGASGGATVGVRPLMTASTEMAGQMPLSKPMMQDVSPVMAEQLPAAQAETEPMPQAEPEPPVPEQPPQTEPAVVAAAEQEPLQLADNGVVDSPLVVKPQQEDKAAEAAAPQEPVELKLSGLEPSPLPAGPEPRKVRLRGTGFVADSKVAMSRSGKVEVLPPEQVEFIDSTTLAIMVLPGVQQSEGAVQVSTPDNRRSNVLRFQITPPPAEEGTVSAEQPVQTSEATAAKPVEPSAASADPEPAMPAKAPQQTTAAAAVASGIKGYDWLAAQPASHYTLQLLASESRQNIESFSRQHRLPEPLAHFTMERKGKRLHMLTQGSYAGRAAAEKAAAKLPAGIKPWIRSIKSVQQVMQRPPRQAPTSGAAPAADESRIKDTAWVWSQDPNRYTVQLAAASEEPAIEAAMRRISLPGELVVVQTQRDGKPWYALVYGSFADKVAARGTIDRLPAAMKEAGPWPRRFADLQDEIRRSTPQQ